MQNLSKLVWTFTILLICFGCSKTHTSYTIYPSEGSDTKAIRISFVNDKVVKVEVSATKYFSKTQSLIEVPDLKLHPFTVEKEGENYLLSSESLLVKVNQLNGKISYLNPDGSQIIAEKEDGRTFKPIEVDVHKGYEIKQVFDTPNDEAIYGLGQHQANEINYKGKNEELFQYNTKVSVPFIVSTKKYGILWDNYSLSRYGNSEPYSNLTQFILYDKNGSRGGLTATYIDDRSKKHIYTKRVETIIDYENLETIKNFPEGFNFNKARIIWEGDIEATTDGLFKFLCYYAGYTKLYIDGELMFDKWRTSWNPSVAKFELEMKKGERHHLQLDWIPDGGVSYIGLKALAPVKEKEQNKVTFYSEMGQNIRYYFVKGNSMDEVISGYRTITGKAQVMPKWSMGFWQSRERYKTQDELLNTLKTFREKQIPIDNIVLDWSYWPKTEWGSHDFDLERFPDAAGMIDQVHELNANIMVSVWPKFYHKTDHFKQFDANGWMYRQAVDDSIKDWISPGYVGSFYDAYNPDARVLFWKQIKEKLYSKGFDAWWLDATEPDILSNASMEYRKKLMTPTAMGPSTEFFNAYALMNAKGIYEGQRSLNNNKRVFILTRSAFAGIQRFGAVTWSGDIGTCWEDLEAQIPAGINFAMSGLPYWTMDIGGFSVQRKFQNVKEGSEELEEWRELNTRWFQFGAFVPLFRVHGQYPYREIFNIAPENHPAYQSMLYYNKLRYRLMPYIYSLNGAIHFDDYTMMRGLVMDFTNDKNVYNIHDQYLFGPSLMVAPVYTYKARERAVYLPKSAGWYDLYSGKYFDGGQTIHANAPYERMPLYVKAGSILLGGPEIEYTNQKPANPIDIYVYSGSNANFILYEDEGTNYNYEKGAYTSIPISWNDQTKAISVGDRKGKFDGMLQNRMFRVVVISKGQAIGFDDQTTFVELKYSGEKIDHTFN